LLKKLFNIYPGEGLPTLILFIYYFAFVAISITGSAARDAYFLNMVDRKYLPLMFLAVAIVLVMVVLVVTMVLVVVLVMVNVMVLMKELGMLMIEAAVVVDTTGFVPNTLTVEPDLSSGLSSRRT